MDVRMEFKKMAETNAFTDKTMLIYFSPACKSFKITDSRPPSLFQRLNDVFE